MFGSDQRLGWFGAFNLAVFVGVFAGRIGRDAALFTAPGGAGLFPLVLVVSAVVLTVVGGRFAVWLEKYSINDMLVRCLLFAGVSMAGFGATLILWPDVPAGVIAVFYVLSDVAAFFGLNLVWMAAELHFGDRERDRDFPKIAGIGLFGICAGALLGLELSSGWLLALWGGLFILLALAAPLGWRRLAAHRRAEAESDVEDDPDLTETTPVPSFFAQGWDDLKWARQERFVWLFTAVTVCNFVLIAIFDQGLAQGAIALETPEPELRRLMAMFVAAMGMIAGLLQLFVMPRLLNRVPIAKLNLVAPLLMLAGVVVLFVFASSSIGGAVRGILPLEPSQVILYALLSARVAGWTAEFLLNQSLLPFIYGALPPGDSGRARFFIEGPITAVTNGGIGLFFMAYFAVVQPATGAAAVSRLIEGLMILGFIAAGAMFVWSRAMIPEFTRVLLARTRSGEDAGWLGAVFNRDLSGALAEAREGILAAKDDGAMTEVEVEILAGAAGTGAIERLSGLAMNEATQAGARASAITNLGRMGADREIEKLLKYFSNVDPLPPEAIVRALGGAGIQAGQSGEVLALFRTWLKSARGGALVGAVAVLRRMGHAGSVEIERHLEDIRQPSDPAAGADPATLLRLAVELESDEVYDQIADAVRKDEMLALDWRAFGEIRFFDRRRALDALILLLGEADRSDCPAAAAVRTLLDKQPWLMWFVIVGVEEPRALAPHLAHRAYWWPELIAGSAGSPPDTSRYDILFKTMEADKIQSLKAFVAPKGIEDAPFDPLKAIEEFLTEDTQAGRRLDVRRYVQAHLTARIQADGNVGRCLGWARALHHLTIIDRTAFIDGSPYMAAAEQARDLGRRLVQAYTGGARLTADDIRGSASGWLEQRFAQWLELLTILLLAQKPSALHILGDDWSPRAFAQAAAGSDVDARDRALRQLEQTDPERSAFLALREMAESYGAAAKYTDQTDGAPSEMDGASSDLVLSWLRQRDDVIAAAFADALPAQSSGEKP